MGKQSVLAKAATKKGNGIGSMDRTYGWTRADEEIFLMTVNMV